MRTLRHMSDGTTIIDAALRFARSNPELVDCAREGAVRSGRSVDDLLLEAIARMRRAIEQQELVELTPYDSRRRYTTVAK
jgi:hypothetical protein